MIRVLSVRSVPIQYKSSPEVLHFGAAFIRLFKIYLIEHIKNRNPSYFTVFLVFLYSDFSQHFVLMGFYDQ